MPIITIVILVHSTQGKTGEGKARWNISRFVAYNDNENDNHNHYSMNSDDIRT